MKNPRAFPRDPSCLFCKIVAREIPAKVAYEDEAVLAFHDVAPKAPTHVLVVPKGHVPGLSKTDADDAALLGTCLAAAAGLAREIGLASYRVVTNDGPDAGQSVPHLHFHVLGGRSFGWPPG